MQSVRIVREDVLDVLEIYSDVPAVEKPKHRPAQRDENSFIQELAALCAKPLRGRKYQQHDVRLDRGCADLFNATFDPSKPMTATNYKKRRQRLTQS
jgi:hypothetical protein